MKKDLQQFLKFTLRASESHTEFLHSLILQVVARQVQLSDNTALWCKYWCKLCTTVISQAAVTQAEMEQKSRYSMLFF